MVDSAISAVIVVASACAGAAAFQATTRDDVYDFRVFVCVIVILTAIECARWTQRRER